MSRSVQTLAFFCGLTLAGVVVVSGQTILKPALYSRDTRQWQSVVENTAADVSGSTNVTPQGPEFTIAGGVGDQVFPEMAVGANGGYLVWQDNSTSPRGLRIMAERLTSGFTANGGPFAVSSFVNSKAMGDQANPQVALSSDGGAVIVWQGQPAATKKKKKVGPQQIYARFLDASGSLLKKDIKVSPQKKFDQADPALATLANGDVIAVWSSANQDGDRQGVFARILSANGSKVSREFQVNQFTLNNQRNPAVAALPNGNFVVAWVSELQRSSASVDVYARIFDSEGNPIGDEFPVNVTTTNACANPSIAASPQGAFMVAWSQSSDVALAVGNGTGNGASVSGVSTVLSDDGWDVLGRLFDSNLGVAISAPFRLNTYTHGDQYAPRICASGAGYFAVWTSLGQDGSREGVFGQALAVNGDFIGEELQINTQTVSRQIQPAVASDGSRFYAAWSSIVIGTGFDLFGRIYLP